jgi:excinuclease ABC subunit B
MRMSTTALLSGRRDILVVASVSCLYGIGNPVEFQKNLIPIEKGQIISRTKLFNSCKVYIQEQKPILILEISE